jgi:hypothetical protein
VATKHQTATIYLTHSPDHSFELSPSETKIRSATQELLNISCNPNFQYRFHMRPSLFPALNQMNPVYKTQNNFPSIHFNIILPLYLGILSVLFHSVFLTITLRAFVSPSHA